MISLGLDGIVKLPILGLSANFVLLSMATLEIFIREFPEEKIYCNITEGSGFSIQVGQENPKKEIKVWIYQSLSIEVAMEKEGELIDGADGIEEPGKIAKYISLYKNLNSSPS